MTLSPGTGEGVFTFSPEDGEVGNRGAAPIDPGVGLDSIVLLVPTERERVATETRTELLPPCASAVPMMIEVQTSDPVAVCRASLAHRVDAGEKYVLEFAFLGHGRCQVACFRQRPGAASDAGEPCQVVASPARGP